MYSQEDLLSCRAWVCRFSHIAVHFTVHLTGSGRAALHNTNMKLQHLTTLMPVQMNIMWEGWRFSSIIPLFQKNLTLCADCLLSDTLLARILNLSTQASKSSLTPTTNNRNTRWGLSEYNMILNLCRNVLSALCQIVFFSEKHTSRPHGFASDHDLHSGGDQNPHSAVLWD